MSYFVYFLFTVWFLSGLGGLLAGALIRFGPPDASRVSTRPAWFHFASALFTLAVASVLLLLYSNGTIVEWWVLIIGSVVFLPEMIYFLFSRRQVRGASS